MSEKNDEPAGDMPLSIPLTYKERVEHFAAGYNNSQAVVRFLDTKASAVIGAVPVVLGLLVGMYRWFEAEWRWEGVSATLGKCGPGLLFAAMTIAAAWLLWQAGAAVNCAFHSIVPRVPWDTLPSLLFPFWVKGDSAVAASSPDADFKSRAAFFAKGAAQSDAIEDYRRQIVRMSEIVQRKFVHVHNAILHLKRVFVLALIIVATLFVMGVGSAVIIQRKTSGQEAANPAIGTTSPPAPLSSTR